MKRILDSVHGYIMIDDVFVKNFVDTTLFQRLRRIEQTSIRSVYPCARHDRFIHSLGVFHIGSLIVDHLKREEKTYGYWGQTETTMKVIYDSYLVACLLHDIAHAPFSHTFEAYFGTHTELATRLKKEVNIMQFSDDLDKTFVQDKPNYHELASALITHKIYRSTIEAMNLNVELIVRMITGIHYTGNADLYHIYNCFISLLHGKVIDADRLDYACRDVWASGYSTSSIDMRRLISSIHIMKFMHHDGNSKKYVVCFESNSINEIEGVLNVKDFQMRYVINHHVVCYEQWLLIMAAEKMAYQYYPDEENGTKALEKIVSINNVIGQTNIPSTSFVLKNISDDDLIFLLKQTDNEYYEQLCSRKYSYAALWKSPDEFYQYFKISSEQYHHDSKMKKFILNALSPMLNESDIIILDAKMKPKVIMDSLFICVNNKVVKYTDLYPSSENININKDFIYVYVRKLENEDNEEWRKRKTELIQKLFSPLRMLLVPAESLNQ